MRHRGCARHDQRKNRPFISRPLQLIGMAFLITGASDGSIQFWKVNRSLFRWESGIFFIPTPPSWALLCQQLSRPLRSSWGQGMGITYTVPKNCCPRSAILSEVRLRVLSLCKSPESLIRLLSKWFSALALRLPPKSCISDLRKCFLQVCWNIYEH